MNTLPDPALQLSLREGVYSLLDLDLNGAFNAFKLVYQSPHWRNRTLAVAGLGDILDTRIIEEGKKPAVMVALGWEMPTSTERHTPLSNERLLVLMDHFLNPALSRPRRLEERKIVHTLRKTARYLEGILLADPHYLVRFDALIMLTHMQHEAKRPYFFPTLQRAYEVETHETIKAILGDLLMPT